LVDLKKLVTSVLPSRSVLRMLILSEPDTLTRENAFAKLEIYVRLLYSELKETNGNK
jgi:hypothetical protein